MSGIDLERSRAAQLTSSTTPTLQRAPQAAGEGAFARSLQRAPETGTSTGAQVLRGTQRVLEAAGPLGEVVNGVATLLGAPDPQADQMERMWQMQRESQAHQVEMLALQEAVAADNRRFTTLSNVQRANHETTRAILQNVRA